MAKDLILLYRIGYKEEAFDLIFKKYVNGIKYFAFRLVGDNETSEDVSQEVMRRASMNISHFPDERRFSSWLYETAKNLCVNELARRGRDPAIRIEDIESARDTSLDPGQIAGGNELRQRIWEIISTLSADDQKIVTGRCIDGKSYKELAQETGYDEPKLWDRMRRARETIEEGIEPYL